MSLSQLFKNLDQQNEQPQNDIPLQNNKSPNQSDYQQSQQILGISSQEQSTDSLESNQVKPSVKEDFALKIPLFSNLSNFERKLIFDTYKLKGTQKAEMQRQRGSFSMDTEGIQFVNYLMMRKNIDNIMQQEQQVPEVIKAQKLLDDNYRINKYARDAVLSLNTQSNIKNQKHVELLNQEEIDYFNQVSHGGLRSRLIKHGLLAFSGFWIFHILVYKMNPAAAQNPLQNLLVQRFALSTFFGTYIASKSYKYYCKELDTIGKVKSSQFQHEFERFQGINRYVTEEDIKGTNVITKSL
eukprot:403359785